jgi:hypothetical protein
MTKPKPPKPRLTDRLLTQVYVTPEEGERFRAAVKAAGVPKAEYTRRCLRAAPVLAEALETLKLHYEERVGEHDHALCGCSHCKARAALALMKGEE